jgi:hypothetical protein
MIPSRRARTRGTSLLAAAVLLVVSSSGCDDGPPPQLCDGSNGLRLHAYSAPAIGRTAAGSAVEIENGSYTLVVDEGCRYYVTAPPVDGVNARFGELRTGILDPAVAQQLAAALPRGQLASLGDCGGVPLSDSSPLVVADLTSHAACAGTFGTRFRGAWGAVVQVWPGLWDRGEAMTGAVRVAASPAAGGPTDVVYPWPLEQPLAPFVLGESDLNRAGVSRLVPTPADAAAMRDLRARHDRGELGWNPPGSGIFTSDGETGAFVYLRDALPHENENGLLPF